MPDAKDVAAFSQFSEFLAAKTTIKTWQKTIVWETKEDDRTQSLSLDKPWDLKIIDLNRNKNNLKSI